MASERIARCFFSTYSTEEILKLSVKEVRNTVTFDSLLHATHGGLYDNAFGPHERDDTCETCGLRSLKCPGHFGHINLPLPVYHPIFFPLLVKLLKGTCFQCHRLVVPKSKLRLIKRQFDLLDQGLLTGALDLEDMLSAMESEQSGSSKTQATFQINICDAIDKEYHSLVETGADSNCLSKNVTRMKNNLLKTFFTLVVHGKLNKTCPNCSAPIQEVRSEHNSRIFLKPVSKTSAKKAIMKRHFDRARSNKENSDDENTIEDAANETDDGDIKQLLKQTYLTPIDVRDHVYLLWDSDKELMNSVFGSMCKHTRKRNGSPDMFFVHVLPVAPSRFRPISVVGEKRFENPQTANLNSILVYCALANHFLTTLQSKDDVDPDAKNELPALKKGGQYVTVKGDTDQEKLQNTWLQLQLLVNSFMDSDLDKLSTDKIPGIRQILEKKEGLFRKHMMGKRVNFAARSVISPDPYINTDEIGIPQVFAKKLTYPQPVTPWNAEELMQAVINGPNVHPGASLVEYENGRGVALNPHNISQRKAEARRLLAPPLENEVTFGCKKVHRHLINGDILLLNRQPTLHRPSIMAHKARVLSSEKTIRLHYANCKAYNADFDGDEMNAHFPQNELARAESYELVSTNHQYLSPKDGKPLSGLIQDHVVSGVRMTTRDVFFTREEYHQLVYNALIDKPGKISILPPCIRKPRMLWSGKQNWPKAKVDSPLSAFIIADGNLDESQVIIRNGELLSGILDKSQYGATAFGLVHSCFELYDGIVCGKLLSGLARLFSTYLRLCGFSLGVEDILVKEKAESRRRKYIKLGRECGDEAAISGLGLEANANRDDIQAKLMEAHHTNNGFGLQLLDHAVKKKTDAYQNKINTSVIPSGLLKPFPQNALQLMIISGAKGSAVNAMQISSLLGQIELEGRRPPLMASGRSLPSFLPYDTCARAGGFVDGRFLTGIRPQEYFFHCMAGREGLVDTAVKTSRSGYLQRCLIKHLEGLVVQYDLTVRDGDGSVVQFLYGEDGIDVCKSQFLEKDRFHFIADNFNEYRDKMDIEDSVEKLQDVLASKRQSKIRRWKNKFGLPFSSKVNHLHQSAFRQFILDDQNELQSGLPESSNLSKIKDLCIKKWRKVPKPEKERLVRHCRPCPDPAICTFAPDKFFGSVSENYDANINAYVASNPTGVTVDKETKKRKKVKTKSFHALLLLKYLRSLASPGDAVGLLASQSIGEPSTQMTLNTFHFAGRGEMNVTLGIPRLREILMTASAFIRTPTMDVLVQEGPTKYKAAQHLQRKLNRVSVLEVLRKVDVSELLVINEGGGGRGNRCRQYKIRLEFLPHSVYKEDYCVKPADILEYVEILFIKMLIKAILKVVKLRESSKIVDTRVNDTPSQREAEARDVSDAEADISDTEGNADGDTADVESRRRQTQFTSYEEPEEEEMIENEEEDEDQVDNVDANDVRSIGDDLDDTEMEDGARKASNQTKNARINNVTSSDDHIVYYDFDESKQRWCEFTLELPVVGTKVMLIPLIEQVAEKAVISEAGGIVKCLLAASQNPNEEGRYRLRTEGVNIEEIWSSQDILNVNSLYTNDIHAFAAKYGIESARRVIIKEIQDVFKVYGIAIDPRHLSLVGDYMTFEGVYRPFNRVGIETNPSPFQKMSFETTTHFLRSATAYGDVDTLGSPSSCLVVGKSVKVGTGIFQLQQPLC